MSRKKSSLAKSAKAAKEESVGIKIFVKPSEIEKFKAFLQGDDAGFDETLKLCERAIFAFECQKHVQNNNSVNPQS